MKNKQQGFVGIVALIVIVVAVVVGGGYVLTKQNIQAPIETVSVPSPQPATSAGLSFETPPVATPPVSISQDSAVSGITENASGIIKSVYTKNGKNYLDIDYIEWNQDWKPGGQSGPAYSNDNSKIRTFEISKDAKFVIPSLASYKEEIVPVSYSQLLSLFSSGSISVNGVTVGYLTSNPWDVVVVNGAVTKITEHYLP